MNVLQHSSRGSSFSTSVVRVGSLAVCAGGFAAATSHAQLATCARIADPAARLECYDRLAQREEAPVASPSAAPPTDMAVRWELEPGLQRGILNLVPHRPVYALAQWTTRPNERPSSPTRPFDVAQPAQLDRVEARMQLSFKSKLAQDVLGTPADLWFGYTQVSHWQVANRRYSSPFRETNYEPEATLVYPTAYAFGGLRVRFAGLTLNHQSNGRGGSLSRSWNRLIGEVGAEYGPLSFHLRPWTRIFEPHGSRDDNPDIEDYAGRGELAATWRGRGHALTATLRHSLRGGERSRGSARLDWAIPLAGALNLHLQVFSGYGLNLVDYNHRQTTVGLGVSFFD